jgi:hypothetical protein
VCGLSRGGFGFEGKFVYIVQGLRVWLEALSPGAVAVVVSGVTMPRALWGTLAGGVVGTLYSPEWALPIATAVTALAMSAWGWPVALALLANWFSWSEGREARGGGRGARGGGRLRREWLRQRLRQSSVESSVETSVERGARGAAAVLWGLLGWMVWTDRGRWESLALTGVGLAANLVVGVLAISRRRRMKQSWILSIMLLFLALPGIAWADDDAGPQPGDVIFYEGFEGFQGFDQRVAAGWLTWSAPGSAAPEYKQANPDVGALKARPYPYRKYSGNNAQQYFTVYRVHDAGLYRVIQAPPGALIEVSAWAEVWTSGEDDPFHSDGAQNTRVRAGLDPDGGVNPDAATVAWGAEINPLSVWQQVPPAQARVGEAGTLTIFLRSTPMYPLKHNDVYWDDVQVTLIELGQAPAPPASSGGPVLASPPVDPILAGLSATGQQRAANSGGWDSLLPALLVLCTVSWSHLRRRGNG